MTNIRLNKYRITNQVSITSRDWSRLKQEFKVTPNIWHAFEFHILGDEDYRNPSIKQAYQRILEKIAREKPYSRRFSEHQEEFSFNLDIKLVGS